MDPLQRKLDGFVGQHLTVLPRPVRIAAEKHPLLRHLLVTDAGYFPRAEGHHVHRERGAPTHLLIACLRGRGWYRGGERDRAVRAGDLVWFRPHYPQAYGANEQEPWTIGWVHFSGGEAEAWREHIGFPDEPAASIGHVSAEGITGLKIEQIYLSLERGYSIPDLISTAILLRSALDGAAHAARQGGATRPALDRIAAVREHLRENLSEPHRLDELAAAAGLSVPHFCALFRRQTGYAPIDFLIRQRMQRACRLLDTTDRAVATIANEVGYADAYYFTRCFRRIVGCAPRKYRQIPKG